MSKEIDTLHKKIDSTYLKIEMMKEEFNFLLDERRRGLAAKATNEMKKAVDHPAVNKVIREKLGNDFVEEILRSAVEVSDDVPVEESQWKYFFKRTSDDLVKLYLEQITSYIELKGLRIEGGEFPDSEPCEIIDRMIDNHRNVIELYEKYKRGEETAKW